MHRLHSLLLFLLALAVAGTTQAAEPLRIRVLSYNIHHGEGVDRRLDLERIAQVVLSVKPDLVALQEVDQKTERTGRVDQPAELARLTKLQLAYGPNIDFQGGKYGNAVLSRWKIIRSRNHLLPNVDESEQRGVMEVELALPDRDVPLLLYATHLDFRADERERLASAEAIEALIEKRPGQPALLAGDLNALPESKTLKLLAKSWTRANPSPLPTVPVKEPSKQIDYVLFRPADRWKVRELHVLDEPVASDHRPIFADLELLPAE